MAVTEGKSTYKNSFQKSFFVEYSKLIISGGFLVLSGGDESQSVRLNYFNVRTKLETIPATIVI